MIAYSEELFYWRSNKDWYGITVDGKFYLKDNAPQKAKESFEKWKEANKD